MTRSHRMRIGSTSYLVTTLEDGTQTYDPPLPEHIAARFQEKSGEVIKSQQFPSIRSNSTFFKDRPKMSEYFDDPGYYKRFREQYKKQTGRTLNEDSVYMGQLADRKFDAEAVIEPHDDANKKVEKLIQRKADKHSKKKDKAPIRLAEDLIQKGVRNYRAKGDKRPLEELRHHVVETHGRKV